MPTNEDHCGVANPYVDHLLLISLPFIGYYSKGSCHGKPSTFTGCTIAVSIGDDITQIKHTINNQQDELNADLLTE
jgi:hypothetical protein